MCSGVTHGSCSGVATKLVVRESDDQGSRPGVEVVEVCSDHLGAAVALLDGGHGCLVLPAAAYSDLAASVTVWVLRRRS